MALGGKGSFSKLPVADDLVSAVPWDTRQRIPEILANYGYQILAPEIGRLRLPDGLGADTLLTGKDEKRLLHRASCFRRLVPLDGLNGPCVPCVPCGPGDRSGDKGCTAGYTGG